VTHARKPLRATAAGAVSATVLAGAALGLAPAAQAAPLITNAPVTFHDRTPGTPFAVGLDLFSTAYDVPAGHRLALVVDTVDPLYIEHNPDGAHLTFSSPKTDPSYMSVPVRDQP
jgi:hypothetical protein